MFFVPKCCSTALRCSASSLPRQLIWILPRSMTCGPSWPVGVGHQSNGGSPPDAPAGSSWNVLCGSATTMSRMVSTWEETAFNSTLCAAPPRPLQPLHSLKTTVRSTATSISTPSCATFSTCWTSGGQSGGGAHSSAWQRSGACSGMFDGVNLNMPYR